MNDSPAHPAFRAACDTALVVAAALAFIFAWTSPGLSDGVRRATSLAACILFVVFFHEAERSWARVRAERGDTRRRV